MSTRLSTVIELIDNANRLDPNLEADSNGHMTAKELLYSQRMSDCMADFCPGASEHLQIAARAQHIERWKSARSDYPEGRVGYLKWRKELGIFHSERAAELMREAEYSDEDIERTQFLIQKKSIKRDSESQTLEDVICLVFLTHYLDPFAAKHDEAKLIDIIQKTWGKMSDNGHAAALKIPFSDSMAALIQKALQ